MGMLDAAQDFGQRVQNFYDKNATLLKASDADTVDSPAAAMALPKPSTSGDASLNTLASAMMAKAQDHGFYGHMTIEKCIQMSGSKSTLRSDKSSFAKNTSNGLSGKKRG